MNKVYIVIIPKTKGSNFYDFKTYNLDYLPGHYFSSKKECDDYIIKNKLGTRRVPYKINIFHYFCMDERLLTKSEISFVLASKIKYILFENIYKAYQIDNWVGETYINFIKEYIRRGGKDLHIEFFKTFNQYVDGLRDDLDNVIKQKLTTFQGIKRWLQQNL